MNINSINTSYSKNTLQNKTLGGNDDREIIQSDNKWESETDKKAKILDEKYRKIYEQNKQFKNPFDHIWDKYRNPHSSYFRSDLTEVERDAAYNNEMCWAQFGTGGQYDFRDAAFRNTPSVPANVEIAECKAFNRQQVNGQLNELFVKNGIHLPEGTKLTFTIDPNTFKLTVSGTKDLALRNQLENVLNSSTNSRELFLHIMKSRSNDSTQFTRPKEDKFHLVNAIKNATGYTLKDLEIVNGKFVTEDGTDILELYKKGLRNNPYDAEGVGIMVAHYGPQLYELAKRGFDSVPDLVLSIDYENGSLQDIGQKENYGTGKTDWIKEWKAHVTSLK